MTHFIIGYALNNKVINKYNSSTSISIDIIITDAREYKMRLYFCLH